MVNCRYFMNFVAIVNGTSFSSFPSVLPPPPSSLSSLFLSLVNTSWPLPNADYLSIAYSNSLTEMSQPTWLEVLTRDLSRYEVEKQKSSI